MAYRKDFHYGNRLKNLVQKSVYTVDQVVQQMDYSSKTSLYRLYDQEWIKPEIIAKALSALKLTEDEFYELQGLVSEPIPEYKKPLYIEQRIDELERIMKEMQSEIGKLKRSLV